MKLESKHFHFASFYRKVSNSFWNVCRLSIKIQKVRWTHSNQRSTRASFFFLRHCIMFTEFVCPCLFEPVSPPAAQLGYHFIYSFKPSWQTGLQIIEISYWSESLKRKSEEEISNPRPLCNEACALPLRYNDCPTFFRATRFRASSRWPTVSLERFCFTSAATPSCPPGSLSSATR